MSDLLVVKFTDRQVEILMNLLSDRSVAISHVLRSFSPPYEPGENGVLLAPMRCTQVELDETRAELVQLGAIVDLLGEAVRG